MQPIPCQHCGYNFMRHVVDPLALRLCNNCQLIENKRNPKKDTVMATVDILVKCPQELYAEIEETCLHSAQDISTYFLNLHKNKKNVDIPKHIEEEQEEEITPKFTHKSKKK